MLSMQAEREHPRLASITEEFVMPYILGWFLGVPVIVLVILYLIFH